MVIQTLHVEVQLKWAVMESRARKIQIALLDTVKMQLAVIVVKLARMIALAMAFVSSSQMQGNPYNAAPPLKPIAMLSVLVTKTITEQTVA